MKSEKIELLCTVKLPDTAKLRKWSAGQRISRADAPMVPVLDVNTVDAVFEEPSFSFLNESQDKSDRGVESLTAQLSELEAQCANLRRLLEASKER